MTRFFVAGAVALALTACGPQTSSPSADDAPRQTLQESLAGLQTGERIDLDALPGRTPAEKLIYITDTPSAAKAGMLIGLEGQITSLRAMGQTETADELEATRPLFLQAADENMDEFLEITSGIYESRFTNEELERLVELHTDPVMQKFIAQQVDMMSEMTVAIETWGITVGQRYAELVAEQEE